MLSLNPFLMPDGTFPNIIRKTGQYADADTGDENPKIYHFESMTKLHS